MSKMLTVYVSGPISNGETIGHESRLPLVEEAIDTGAMLMMLGHAPFIPHYSYYMEDLGYEFDYEDWMNIDFRWVETCDAVFRMEGESKGADREVEYARSLGKTVFMNLDEVPDGR